MKIGVLSDTHLHDIGTAQTLAKTLLKGPFAEVEAILHAGDLVVPLLEDCFAPLPWYGVRGNMDPPLPDLPISRVVQLAGYRIGLIHGWGAHDQLEQRVLEHFMGDDLDALVYGHSHQPVCRYVESLLLMNPGSATDKRRAAHHSVGILTLTDRIVGEIIALD